MKSTKILLSALTILFILSCKNDKKENETVVETEKLPETFNIAFNLTVTKDDVFQLYYTEDGTLNFSDAMSIKTVIKGGETAQDVLFKLPVDVLPTNIRLDFGKNIEQGVIGINSMKLKYIDKSFDVNFKDPNNSIPHYFYFINTQINYNEANSTITILNKEGQNREPLMWSNELVTDELEKLYKN